MGGLSSLPHPCLLSLIQYLLSGPRSEGPGLRPQGQLAWGQMNVPHPLHRNPRSQSLNAAVLAGGQQWLERYQVGQ